MSEQNEAIQQQAVIQKNDQGKEVVEKTSDEHENQIKEIVTIEKVR